MTCEYNVVVLIFDTLRSDYLSCYGGDANTPAFELGDEGVVFESAFGVAPGTPVSHASIYTGQYPSEHGVTGQYIPLPEDVPVIAEWFRDAGYDTFGVAGPSKMGSDWGYDRGFDEFFEHYYDLPPIKSVESVRRALTDRLHRERLVRAVTKGGEPSGHRTRFKFELLERNLGKHLDRPFFALCNFTTVHSPYDPPRPYKQRMTPEYSRPRLSLLEYLLNELGTIDDPEVRLERVKNVQQADGVGRYLADPSYLNDKEIQLLRDWYRASVEYLDDELERFLEFYRRELREDTFLVLTADHGEQLGEHGLWTHSYYLYDETLEVPLIIVGPDIPVGHRRKDLVSHVDLFDTLCDLCDLVPPDDTSGSSVFSDSKREMVFMEYGERDEDEFSENSDHGRYLDREQLRHFAAGRKAVRTDRYRFEMDSNGTERLFAVPEQTEIPDPPAEFTRQLRESILETLGEDFGVWPEGDPDDVRLTQRVTENLRELGYIG